MNHTKTDQQLRTLSLTTNLSFIVQAPAGSGKTELLTQRYLSLLANAANKPEEILAITFTKKAANEMKQRILTSLHRAAEQTQPSTEPAKTNWDLAQQVLRKNKLKGWHILENPQRLNLYTFDGFALSLVKQLPILSQLGQGKHINADSAPLYQGAATALITDIETNDNIKAALITLLRHLDNRVERFIELIASLLQKRDQWVQHLLPFWHTPDEWQHHLNQQWHALEAYFLEAICMYFQQHADLFEQLVNLTAYALKHLTQSQLPEGLIVEDTNLFAQPNCQPSSLTLNDYKLLCFLLTRQQASTRIWRSASAHGVTARIGFPAPSKTQSKLEQDHTKQQKQHMITLLEHLDHGHQTLLELFCWIDPLPTAVFDQDNWQVLASLLQVLPHAFAALSLSFKANNSCDFTAIGLGAVHALGAADDPSDLLLKMDHQIQHILIDEFQDTSIAQYDFIKLLTAGWMQGDGRTLFLVGDPQQSIYRFREADVSLFYRVRAEGLGDVELADIRLRRNFRSAPELIQWFNQVFQPIFPKVINPLISSVTYETASAGKDQLKPNQQDQTPSQLVPLQVSHNTETQMSQVAQTLKEILTTYPHESIAILVRSRTNSSHLFKALQAANISYHGKDMQKLSELNHIKDLITLAHAMFDWYNALAWAALLRSPFCGLTLVELQHLVDLATASEQDISWPFINTVTASSDLDDTLKQRLECFCKILRRQFHYLGRVSAKNLLYTTFNQLGGNQQLSPVTQQEIDTCFHLIEQVDQGGFPDLDEFTTGIEKAYAKDSLNEDAQVQIMTIHKSKGLEFDHVLLLQLDSQGPPEKTQLMAWQQIALPQKPPILLVAPGKQAYQSQVQYDFLQKIQSAQAQQELMRLFYVAATRAKKRLYLFANYQAKIKTRNNFLGLLTTLPSYRESYENNSQQDQSILDIKQQPPEHTPTSLLNQKRLHQFIRPELESWLRYHKHLDHALTDTKITDKHQNPVIDLGELGLDNKRRSIALTFGVFLHRWLQNFDPQKHHWETYFDLSDFNTQPLMTTLKSENLNSSEETLVLAQLETSLRHIKANQQLKKIRTQHTKLQLNEIAMSVRNKSSQSTSGVFFKILDHLSMDEEQTLWIVDYKFNLTANKGEVDTLEKIPSAYVDQLKGYAQILSKVNLRTEIKETFKLDQMPTGEHLNLHLALYYPVQDVWIEVR